MKTGIRKSGSALVLLGALAVGPCAFANAPYLGVAPQGDAQAGAKIATTTCAACHGVHGNSRGDTFPNLAGQNYNYLLKQLEDFRNGSYKAPTMSAMIQGVPKAPDEQNLKNIARYFADQKPDRTANANASAPKPTLDQAKMGYRIYQQGLPGAKVPSCAACHTAGGMGNAPMAIPALAGQHATYIEQQLKAFADGKRANSPHHVMAMIAKRLTPAEITDVALYAQQLRPGLVPGSGPMTYQAYVKARARQPVQGLPADAIKSGGQKTAMQSKQ
ncbi:MAG: c-type cytochrome [Gammaproteobacteria bacterium]